MEETVCMEQEATKLSAAEAAEYGEFKRARRQAELTFTLTKLMIDASRRETDKTSLRRACETAARLNVSGVEVSPVNVAAARRLLGRGSAPICCLVGGTGESLTSVKRMEAKKAIRMGAQEIRLVPCFSQLTSGGYSYLKREIRRLKKCVRRGTLTVSLDDRSLNEEEVAVGVRAAAAGKADAVSVRGETELVIRAVKEAAGRLTVEAAGVENAEQLRVVLQAGATRASTGCCERIAEELYSKE